jgi:hypothetical protein
MGGAKPANPSAQPPLPLSNDTAATHRPAVGSGLSTLLQGQRPEEAAAKPTRPAELQGDGRFSRHLTWTLLAADLLLVTLAVWIVARGTGRPHLTEMLLVAAALGLGAWLGCYAFLLRR